MVTKYSGTLPLRNRALDPWRGRRESRVLRVSRVREYSRTQSSGACFSKVPKLFGSISGDIILFVSSKRRRLEARNFAVIFIFIPFTTYEKNQLYRIRRSEFRLRKVFGTFGKRAPGYTRTRETRKTRDARRLLRFSLYSIWDQPIKYSVGTAVNQATFAPKDIVLYLYMKYLANLQEMAEI